MTIEYFKAKHEKEFKRLFFKEEKNTISKVGDFLFKPRYNVNGIKISLID